MASSLRLVLFPSKQFTLVQYGTKDTFPPSILGSEWYSITRTNDELSILFVESTNTHHDEASLPSPLHKHEHMCCIKVAGPLDLSLTGILASIADPLRDAKIPIFAMSTYNTDYIFIDFEHFDSAKRALENAGHTVLLSDDLV
eukprot:TRINITY_DN28919_c0_g1_i1.p1 TRINITY_DN28919_c0_g1~~TRINITY_DN28919_c0_g1_i1.p1  ORF type:complete len:143 (+),score=15.66 TRINITY_DN28919_c0_g1_i1:22-450(+)